MATSIGISVEQIQSRLKVTGRAWFGADECVADQLWCAFVRSPVPHARILSIDTARAHAIVGVCVVITGDDLPARRWGRRLQDVPVLAVDRVRIIGEKVVAIAAETRDAPEEAARLVEVEYDELPAVFDPEAALRGDVLVHDPDAHYEDAPTSWGAQPNVQSWVTLSHGDVERAMAQADRVLEVRPKSRFGHILQSAELLAKLSPRTVAGEKFVARTFRPRSWSTSFASQPYTRAISSRTGTSHVPTEPEGCRSLHRTRCPPVPTSLRW